MKKFYTSFLDKDKYVKFMALDDQDAMNKIFKVYPEYKETDGEDIDFLETIEILDENDVDEKEFVFIDIDKMIKLVNNIKKHDQLYWEENDSKISDPEYDQLVRELKTIDPNHPLINKVHTPVQSSNKVKLSTKTMSLNKVYDVKDLIKWCLNVARTPLEIFLLQPKYDGCSAELKNNILTTHGDGEYGENITDKLSIIKIEQNTQSISNMNFDGDIRGEIIIKKSDFELCKNNLTRKNGQPYKNSRNASAGLLNKKDIDKSLGPILTLVDFNLNSQEIIAEQVPLLDWDKLCEEAINSDYPCDGLVIKLKDQKYKKLLGCTSHHPRGEMALKFINPTGKSVLVDVIWSPGKNNLTPVGKIKPVQISGVTITNVNLHNFKYIIDNNISINDELIIERCGDVIPDIKTVIPGKERIKIVVLYCPVCRSNVDYIEPNIICTNNNCSGKHLNQLMDSIRRIGIERLGEPTVVKLINEFNCKNLIDIFNLTKEDILQLEGFGDVSSNNLYNEIQKVKKEGVHEWQILASLNLLGIGETLSKKLLEIKVINDLKLMSKNDILNLPDMGPERTYILLTGLRKNSEYIEKLFNILPIKIKEEIKIMPKICFTGKMPEKRKYYQDLARSNGFDPVDSVNKNLDLLVCADLNSNSTKMKKAQKNEIKIISLEQFMDQGEILC